MQENVWGNADSDSDGDDTNTTTDNYLDDHEIEMDDAIDSTLRLPQQFNDCGSGELPNDYDQAIEMEDI